jgi:hypothetical protein
MNTVHTFGPKDVGEPCRQRASNRTRIAPGAPREPLLAGIEIGGSPKLEQIRSPAGLLVSRLGAVFFFLALPWGRAGPATDLGYYQGARPPPSGPFRGNVPEAGAGGVNRAYFCRTGLWARPRPGALGGALVMPRKIWSGPMLPPPKFPGVAMESCLLYVLYILLDTMYSGTRYSISAASADEMRVMRHTAHI